jgi:16S rRNA (cytosine967-C5)-methyltransferase
MNGGGRITACDVAGDKLEELRRRARRAGVTNLTAIRIERGGALPFSGLFDRVLVDAPCTGTGVFRRNPEARWRLGPRDLEELPDEQLPILRRAAGCVAVGGRLVYATCSVMDAENDAIVDKFINEFPSFERVLVKEILGTDRAAQIGDGACLRTSPESHGADGFFAAVLRRRAE